MNACECGAVHQHKRIVLTGGPGAGKTAITSCGEFREDGKNVPRARSRGLDPAAFQPGTDGTPREQDKRGEANFMKHLQTTLLFAAVILGMPLLPLLAQSAAQPPAVPPVVMSAMMETCQKNCSMMSSAMADLTKTIDAAKASSDVSKLHEALDQVQTTLAKMQTQSKDCNAMMEHMRQMMPMSGGASH